MNFPLNEVELDIFNEIINIGVGRSANSLSHLLNSYVSIEAPTIRMWSYDELVKAMDNGETKSLIRLNFSGPMFGSASLVFDKASAINLVNEVSDDDEDSLDAIKTGTLTEIGNIILNGIMGILGNVIEQRIIYEVPIFEESITVDRFLDNKLDWENILVTTVSFRVNEHEIHGEIYLFFTNKTIETLRDTLNNLLELESIA